MRRITCTLKPYIQPFEKRLALSELEALTGAVPRSISTDSNNSQAYEVVTETTVAKLAKSLVYWERVLSKQSRVTLQVKKEAASTIAANGVSLKEFSNILPLPDTFPLPRRRCLRYGTHGIHEYRGKFFPQLVQSLLNISDSTRGSLVLDPMCGSGTTLVESRLRGCKSYGLDMNPLSVLMARVKSDLLSEEPQEIQDSFVYLSDRLRCDRERRVFDGEAYARRIPEGDKYYLARWFDPSVLDNLFFIKSTVESIQNQSVRRFFLVVLSNVLRPLSWQKTDDLRIRREVWDAYGVNPTGVFLKEAEKSVRSVTSFLYQNRGQPLGPASVQMGDARHVASQFSQLKGRVSTVITSPPYATALPYLDTDRLSLVFLGLLPKETLRKHDVQMIGNREITKGLKDEYWQNFQKSEGTLPDSVRGLIEHIHALNEGSEAGFRRKNLPALLSKYFLDMKEVLASSMSLLAPGANLYIVVGDNHTVAGGERVSIKTAELLVDLAEMLGLKSGEHLPMEMLNSRDIFRQNASSTETVLSLRML